MKKLLTILMLLPVMAMANFPQMPDVTMSSAGITNTNSNPTNPKDAIVLSEKNTINFNGKFTNSFVSLKQVEAMAKCGLNPNSDIYIVLYTPGGSVSAGQLFFDSLKALPCNFHTITVFAASMGYQTVQNLGTRYIMPSGILMSHRAYVTGLSGEIGGELESIYKLLKDNVNELDKVAAKRVGLSLKAYQELVADELWLTAEQAVKRNHADKVSLVKCDSSLSGTYYEKVSTFFGEFTLEFSKCPIVTGVLSVSGYATRRDVKNVKDFYENMTKYIVRNFEL